MAARLFLLAALALAGALGAHAQSSPAAVSARHGMVVAEEARAAQIGVEILQQGGNAVDAAVAVGFALAVTLPESGGLGGGGFMVVHLAREARTLAVDYRETAPAAATRDMYLDAKGEADPELSRNTGLGVGVPGTVAGLALAHRNYGSGKFSLAQLIAPAIRLARDGIEMDAQLSASLARIEPRLARYDRSRAIFLAPDGTVPGDGARLVQRDLALTLEAIALEGAHAFYEGPIADEIAAAVRRAGGRMTREDLARYRAVERAPVSGSYRGHEIFSMPPPSSGGVHLVQMLNILEGFDLAALGPGSPAKLHLLIEAMKLAYADRSEHLGDPAFAPVPVRALTAKSYAEALRAGIDPGRARSAAEIAPARAALLDAHQTTHFSVVDRDGNAVANTVSLNFYFGLGKVAGDTGVVLNNQLDDFAAAPGAPNAYGLVGGDMNAPGAGKRPLSSMSPTVVLQDGRVWLVTGAAGGSRIINTVLQVIVNAVDHRMDAAAAVRAPRVHHQWLPDEVNVEPGIAEETRAALTDLRHILVERSVGASANTILAVPGGWTGAGDPRRPGSVVRGY